jgi:TPP-dependent pyruvate/acetoin dehydrogenase alpha subunit
VTDTAVAPDVIARKQQFAAMLRIRMIEETIADRYAEQEMRCPVHLSIGQEAVAVGVCAALERRDYVVSTHRAHAHYLAKGGNLRAMMAEIYGKETGCCSGRGGSMHLIDLAVNMLGSTPIVGSSLPVAVGSAFGSVLHGEPDRITAAFFGEGMTEEGTFGESLNFAALKKLPVLFVCENNLFSVYSPMNVRQPAARDRCAIARAHGMTALQADGNDVSAVFAATRQAVALARRGEGPVYLEFDTYRWREHCGPNYDNDIGYRTEEEYLSWRARCPIEGLEAQLLADGAYSSAELAALRAALDSEIGDAFAFAEASPFPDPTPRADDIYALGTP